MARTSKIIRGAGIGYLHQGVTILVGLWLTNFLLTRLGQSEYGAWLIVTQVLAYLFLLDLGVIALLPREVAAASGKPAAGGRSVAEVVSQTSRHVMLQLPLVAGGAILAWFLLPDEWARIRPPLAIVGVAFVFTFPLRIFQAALQGLQDLAAAGIITMIAWASGTATVVVLVVAGVGINSLAYGWVVTEILTIVLSFARIRRRFPEALPRRLSTFDRSFFVDRLARCGWVSLSRISHVLLAGTDLLIIGKLLGPGATVPYFCTAKLVTVLANQPQMILEASAPALSQLRSEEGADRINLASSALTQVILLLSGLITCVVIAANRGFVGWWVGESFYGGAALTYLLVGRTVLRHWNSTAMYANFAFGHDRHNSIVSITDGVVTVALGFILGSFLGLEGIVIASIVTACIIALPVNLSKLGRETARSPLAQIGVLLPWIWRFALVTALATLLSSTSVAATPIGAAGFATVAGFAYCAMMFPLALREPAGVYIKPRIERFLPQRFR